MVTCAALSEQRLDLCIWLLPDWSDTVAHAYRYPQAYIRQVTSNHRVLAESGTAVLDESDTADRQTLAANDQWQMFVAFSNNKEDIWVATVDLPID